MAEFAHPSLGSYRGFARAMTFGRTPGPQPFAAPTLGQHTEQVLAGLSEAQVQAASQDGA